MEVCPEYDQKALEVRAPLVQNGADDHGPDRGDLTLEWADIGRLNGKTNGTSILLTVPEASLEAGGANYKEPEFLQKLVFQYSIFNPHATFALHQNDARFRFPPTKPEWQKWRPTDLTSVHWYTPEQFEELGASYVAAEREGGRSRTVREFVAEFRGLRGTGKQKAVAAQAGLERAYLHDLVEATKLNRGALERLRRAMCQASEPVAPKHLGILGSDHWKEKLDEGNPSDEATEASFRYRKLTGISEENGLPYVVECAFRLTENEALAGLHIGLNWSVPLSDPFEACAFGVEAYDPEFGSRRTVSGLSALLEALRISVSQDPIALILHVACPRFTFFDRGKGSVDLPSSLARAVSTAIVSVTKEWSAIKRKQERDQHVSARRLTEHLRRGRARDRVTIKDAAWQVIPSAYLEASRDKDGNSLPTKARQVMYAARGEILRLTGLTSFDDNNFTQELLPRYIREHPDECAGWEIVYDARGHLLEPHTKCEIGVGTSEVKAYLEEAKQNAAMDCQLTIPELSSRYPTRGPRNRYGAILFIEKEGFNALFDRVHLGERFDMAIMSSKGMGSTSARTLLEALSPSVKIFVLHDFDKSGFSIVGTLRRDTKRFQFTNPPEIIDLGLHLDDVQQYDLQPEPEEHSTDPEPNLLENGATAEEIEFLRGEAYSNDKKGRETLAFHGRRVELNALTNRQLLEWLEVGLIAHGVRKVIPDDGTLGQAYRRAVALHVFERRIQAARPKAETAARAAEVPKDLKQQVAHALKKNPAAAWDDVLMQLAMPEDVDN